MRYAKQVRYDVELKRYLKTTGLRAKDLKNMAKEKKPKEKAPPRHHNVQQTSAATNPQLAQTFMGLPIAGMGSPMMAVGMPGMGQALLPGAMGMLPHFPQAWAAGQQYPGQPAVVGPMGIAGQLHFAQGQGLYSNGYADNATAAAGGSASASTTTQSKQTMPSRDGQSPPMYR